MARGVGRWQLLSGKLIMLMGASVSAVIVTGVLIGIASLLAGVIPPGEEGSLIANDAGAWLDAVKGAGPAGRSPWRHTLRWVCSWRC